MTTKIIKNEYVMLGKLTTEAFRHDNIVMFGVLSMFGAGILVIILLTVYKNGNGYTKSG
jgi:hypothetical protein